jgi:hypothetical protein
MQGEDHLWPTAEELQEFLSGLTDEPPGCKSGTCESPQGSFLHYGWCLKCWYERDN